MTFEKLVDEAVEALLAYKRWTERQAMVTAPVNQERKALARERRLALGPVPRRPHPSLGEQAEQDYLTALRVRNEASQVYAQRDNAITQRITEFHLRDPKPVTADEWIEVAVRGDARLYHKVADAALTKYRELMGDERAA